MLNFNSSFPLRSNAPDANYPYGSSRLRTSEGSNDGTLWVPDILNDWLGFQAAVVNAAGITPSGNPDTVLASNVLAGIVKIAGDFKADGSVPMSGSLNLGDNSIIGLSQGEFGPGGTNLSVSFIGDPDTGLLSTGDNILQIVAGITNFSIAPLIALDGNSNNITVAVGSNQINIESANRIRFRVGTDDKMYLEEDGGGLNGLLNLRGRTRVTEAQDPIDAQDLVTKAYGDANYIGGDFMADGSVAMTGTLRSTLGNDDAFAHWGSLMISQNSGGETVLGRMPSTTYQSWFKLTGSTASMRSGASAQHSVFTLREDYTECNNNIRAGGSALNALLPAQNNDLIRKDYFDQNVSAGDFLADGSVPMTGKINIDSAVVGGFEHDGTIKMQVAATSVSFSPVSSTVLTITDTAVQLSNSTDLIAQKNIACTEFVTSGSTTLDAKPPTANNHTTRKDWVEKTFQTKPTTIAGFTASQYYKVTPEDPAPLSMSEFDGAVGVSVSIGPTGSGANVIWSALDALPPSALSVTVMFTLAYIDSTIAGDVQFNVTIPPGGVGTRALIRQKSGTDEAGFTITQIDIPLSATNVLNLTSLVTNSSINGVNLTFVGFHDAQ